MIKKFVIKKSACVTVAVVFGLSLFALAQADAAASSPAAAATTPNAPSAAAHRTVRSLGSWLTPRELLCAEPAHSSLRRRPSWTSHASLR